MIKRKKDLFALLAEHQDEIRRYGVRRWDVFGSFVSGEPNDRSDVDILVEFEAGKKSFDNFMRLATFLEQQIGRRVELVTPESLSPHIGPHILSEWSMPPVVAEFLKHIIDELNYLSTTAQGTDKKSFLNNG